MSSTYYKMLQYTVEYYSKYYSSVFYKTLVNTTVVFFLTIVNTTVFNIHTTLSIPFPHNAARAIHKWETYMF
jgi:hypothetical protein